MKRNYTLRVDGRGRFPIDMLRYSQAYPADDRTVAAIEDSFDVSERRSYYISINDVAYASVDNCMKRFASFGFKTEIIYESEAA